ncbi:SCUBE3 [Branchiostoma lanceolatum]|uniref:SCUBE3 protein n=1 Tax=Branchiostoma lanceolatum TaxID=7740 RepID=A0A8J9Z616_BRALA|nr:SCUBE3 [Branchiostoma lanceolatum]
MRVDVTAWLSNVDVPLSEELQLEQFQVSLTELQSQDGVLLTSLEGTANVELNTERWVLVYKEGILPAEVQVSAIRNAVQLYFGRHLVSLQTNYTSMMSTTDFSSLVDVSAPAPSRVELNERFYLQRLPASVSWSVETNPQVEFSISVSASTTDRVILVSFTQPTVEVFDYETMRADVTEWESNLDAALSEELQLGQFQVSLTELQSQDGMPLVNLTGTANVELNTERWVLVYKEGPGVAHTGLLLPELENLDITQDLTVFDYAAMRADVTEWESNLDVTLSEELQLGQFQVSLTELQSQDGVPLVDLTGTANVELNAERWVLVYRNGPGVTHTGLLLLELENLDIAQGLTGVLPADVQVGAIRSTFEEFFGSHLVSLQTDYASMMSTTDFSSLVDVSAPVPSRIELSERFYLQQLPASLSWSVETNPQVEFSISISASTTDRVILVSFTQPTVEVFDYAAMRADVTEWESNLDAALSEELQLGQFRVSLTELQSQDGVPLVDLTGTANVDLNAERWVLVYKNGPGVTHTGLLLPELENLDITQGLTGVLPADVQVGAIRSTFQDYFGSHLVSLQTDYASTMSTTDFSSLVDVSAPVPSRVELNEQFYLQRLPASLSWSVETNPQVEFSISVSASTTDRVILASFTQPTVEVFDYAALRADVTVWESSLDTALSEELQLGQFQVSLTELQSQDGVPLVDLTGTANVELNTERWVLVYQNGVLPAVVQVGAIRSTFEDYFGSHLVNLQTDYASMMSSTDFSSLVDVSAPVPSRVELNEQFYLQRLPASLSWSVEANPQVEFSISVSASTTDRVILASFTQPTVEVQFSVFDYAVMRADVTEWESNLDAALSEELQLEQFQVSLTELQSQDGVPLVDLTGTANVDLKAERWVLVYQNGPGVTLTGLLLPELENLEITQGLAGVFPANVQVGAIRSTFKDYFGSHLVSLQTDYASMMSTTDFSSLVDVSAPVPSRIELKEQFYLQRLPASLSWSWETNPQVEFSISVSASTTDRVILASFTQPTVEVFDYAAMRADVTEWESNLDTALSEELQLGQFQVALRELQSQDGVPLVDLTGTANVDLKAERWVLVYQNSSDGTLTGLLLPELENLDITQGLAGVLPANVQVGSIRSTFEDYYGSHLVSLQTDYASMMSATDFSSLVDVSAPVPGRIELNERFYLQRLPASLTWSVETNPQVEFSISVSASTTDRVILASFTQPTVEVFDYAALRADVTVWESSLDTALSEELQLGQFQVSLTELQSQDGVPLVDLTGTANVELNTERWVLVYQNSSGVTHTGLLLPELENLDITQGLTGVLPADVQVGAIRSTFEDYFGSHLVSLQTDYASMMSTTDFSSLVDVSAPVPSRIELSERFYLQQLPASLSWSVETNPQVEFSISVSASTTDRVILASFTQPTVEVFDYAAMRADVTEWESNLNAALSEELQLGQFQVSLTELQSQDGVPLVDLTGTANVELNAERWVLVYRNGPGVTHTGLLLPELENLDITQGLTGVLPADMQVGAIRSTFEEYFGSHLVSLQTDYASMVSTTDFNSLVDVSAPVPSRVELNEQFYLQRLPASLSWSVEANPQVKFSISVSASTTDRVILASFTQPTVEVFDYAAMRADVTEWESNLDAALSEELQLGQFQVSLTELQSQDGVPLVNLTGTANVELNAERWVLVYKNGVLPADVQVGAIRSTFQDYFGSHLVSLQTDYASTMSTTDFNSLVDVSAPVPSRVELNEQFYLQRLPASLSWSVETNPQVEFSISVSASTTDRVILASFTQPTVEVFDYAALRADVTVWESSLDTALSEELQLGQFQVSLTELQSQDGVPLVDLTGTANVELNTERWVLVYQNGVLPAVVQVGAIRSTFEDYFGSHLVNLQTDYASMMSSTDFSSLVDVSAPVPSRVELNEKFYLQRLPASLSWSVEANPQVEFSISVSASTTDRVILASFTQPTVEVQFSVFDYAVMRADVTEWESNLDAALSEELQLEQFQVSLTELQSQDGVPLVDLTGTANVDLKAERWVLVYQNGPGVTHTGLLLPELENLDITQGLAGVLPANVQVGAIRSTFEDYFGSHLVSLQTDYASMMSTTDFSSLVDVSAPVPGRIELNEQFYLQRLPASLSWSWETNPQVEFSISVSPSSTDRVILASFTQPTVEVFDYAAMRADVTEWESNLDTALSEELQLGQFQVALRELQSQDGVPLVNLTGTANVELVAERWVLVYQNSSDGTLTGLLLPELENLDITQGLAGVLPANVQVGSIRSTFEDYYGSHLVSLQTDYASMMSATDFSSLVDVSAPVPGRIELNERFYLQRLPASLSWSVETNPQVEFSISVSASTTDRVILASFTQPTVEVFDYAAMRADVTEWESSLDAVLSEELQLGQFQVSLTELQSQDGVPLVDLTGTANVELNAERWVLVYQNGPGVTHTGLLLTELDDLDITQGLTGVLPADVQVGAIRSTFEDYFGSHLVSLQTDYASMMSTRDFSTLVDVSAPIPSRVELTEQFYLQQLPASLSWSVETNPQVEFSISVSASTTDRVILASFTQPTVEVFDYAAMRADVTVWESNLDADLSEELRFGEFQVALSELQSQDGVPLVDLTGTANVELNVERWVLVYDEGPGVTQTGLLLTELANLDISQGLTVFDYVAMRAEVTTWESNLGAALSEELQLGQFQVSLTELQSQDGVPLVDLTGTANVDLNAERWVLVYDEGPGDTQTGLLLTELANLDISQGLTAGVLPVNIQVSVIRRSFQLYFGRHIESLQTDYASMMSTTDFSSLVDVSAPVPSRIELNERFYLQRLSASLSWSVETNPQVEFSISVSPSTTDRVILASFTQPSVEVFDYVAMRAEVTTWESNLDAALSEELQLGEFKVSLTELQSQDGVPLVNVVRTANVELNAERWVLVYDEGPGVTHTGLLLTELENLDISQGLTVFDYVAMRAEVTTWESNLDTALSEELQLGQFQVSLTELQSQDGVPLVNIVGTANVDLNVGRWVLVYKEGPGITYTGLVLPEFENLDITQGLTGLLPTPLLLSVARETFQMYFERHLTNLQMDYTSMVTTTDFSSVVDVSLPVPSRIELNERFYLERLPVAFSWSVEASPQVQFSISVSPSTANRVILASFTLPSALVFDYAAMRVDVTAWESNLDAAMSEELQLGEFQVSLTELQSQDGVPLVDLVGTANVELNAERWVLVYQEGPGITHTGFLLTCFENFDLTQDLTGVLPAELLINTASEMFAIYFERHLTNLQTHYTTMVATTDFSSLVDVSAPVPSRIDLNERFYLQRILPAFSWSIDVSSDARVEISVSTTRVERIILISFILPGPIDGQFGSWSDWSECTATCGVSVQTRTRTCDSPPPQGGGRYCEGDASQFQVCVGSDCPRGFVDWCDQVEDRCGVVSHGGICAMRRRDYVCFCQNGYNRITDNLGNFLRCVDVDECTTGLSNCAPGVGVCTNTPGGFTCKCPKGYTGNGIFCADINECLDPALSKCDENAHCTNSLGGFSCDCVEGFISIAEEGTAFTGECKAVDLLPYGADVGDIQLFITLHYVWQFPPFIITEVVSPPIYVDYGVPLMDGKLFHYIYIIENGLVIMSDRRIYVPTLRNPVSLSSVLRFVYADNIAVFAPFWTNNRFYNLLLGHAPKVWYQVYTEQSHFVMTVVNKLVIQQFSPTFSFRAKLVLVVTYDSMVPPWTATTQEVNTVQLVIATDYAHTFVLYKYPRGRMKWTPVFSTNQAQFYSFPARIGFVIRHTNTFGIRTEWSVEDPNSGQWSRMTGRPNAFRISDRLPTGLLAYRVETNSDTWVNPRLACQSWFEEEEDPLTWALSLVGRCPSTMAHALQEYGTFTTSPSEYRNAICFTRLFSSSSGGNMDCCYELFTGALLGGNRVNSGAGFLRRYERTSNQYYTREYLPYQWCTMQARSTAYVDRYVSRRIMSSSSSYRMVIQGTGFGDPHLATADGVEFTFNGYNEYVLLRSRSSAPYRFELQGRTSQSATRNGNVKATVFTAFAFRQPDDKVEVFLSEDSSSFLVRVNGQEVPISAIVNGSRSTFGDGRMFPRYANGNGQSNATGLLVSFPSGASVVINLSNNILTYTVGVAQDMQGQLEGMLGNFDGRYLGDFAFPNGTAVPLIDPRNPKEEELFSFGNTWSLRALSAFDGTSVNDLSLFTYYPQGTSPMTYGDDSFRPTFFGDDLSVLFGDASLQEQAVAVCGSVTARECLYDVAITGDLSFGNDTMNHEKAFKDACGILMNSPPELEYPEEIVAYVNQEYNVTLNATDDKDKTVTFTLTGNGTMERTGNLTASFSWLPTSVEKAYVEFIVTDSTGAASSITPKITICGCQNNGTCEFDRIISRDNGFAMAPCICVPGFAGDMCEQDADGCADIPCFQGKRVTCTDVKGEINITAGEKGYTCGPCPDDTTGDGETCEDVDECLLDAGDPRCHKCVNANCVNTPGSYTCVCKEGFHKDGDDKVCYDIDECRSDNTNDCDWVFGYCNNTEGGYECLCDPGFISYDGGLTCEDLNECLINNGGCQRICKNNEGSYECDCGVAYYLTSDEHTCIELDECETNTKCEYYCEDFVGHYECYCPDLFSADENGRTCSPYVNCTSNNTCHPAPIGACAQNWTTDEDTCFCVRGYELQLDNSCRDIDECTNGEARCDENSIGCNNTPGDYKCICKNGYELSVSHGLRKCHNINECNDNYGNCSHECEDTVGSFYCDCPKGWRLGSDQRTCEDIDECSSDALNDCSHNAVCNNTIGGYLCQCQDGFSGDGSLCGDIDECIQLGERGQGGCEVGCTNFNGGYVCTCGTGYQLKNDSVSCEDIDECSVPGTCEQACNNTLGSYFCSCSGDNVLREDGSTCRLNTNLCNHGCHEKANYIKENYTCVCRSGYSGNGTNCDIADPGVVVEVTLDNLEYTEGLGDCTSVAFIKLKGDVESALSVHFTGHQNFTIRENFLSFILSSFSNGSVVANLTLATKNLMSDQDIQQAMTNVRALSIGNLNVFTELCYPGHCLYGGSCSVSGAQRQCSCTIGRGGSRCEYLLSATTAGIVVAILVVVAPLLLVAACVLRRKNIEETAKLYRGSRSHSHIWWNMTRPRFKASFPNVPMQGAGWVTLRKRHGLGTYVEAFPYVDLDVRRYFPNNRRYDALSEGSVSTWRSSSVSTGTTSTLTGDSTWVAEWDDYMKVFGGDSEVKFSPG